MTLMTSMYSGWSGLRASSTQLSVIGDNIANANTIGFKGSRAVFQEALAQTMMGGGLGTGTGLQAIQRILSQGALLQTGIPSDLAMSGDGYFLLSGKHNGVDGNFYTRAGQFTEDKDGFLSSLDGLKVQGYQADATGVVGGTVGDIQVGNASYPPEPTANITLQGNLSAAAVPPDPLTLLDPADPTTYNYQQSVRVYDSLGNAREVTIYFRHNGGGNWEYGAYTDGANVTGGTAGTPSQIGTGTLTYNTDGILTGQTQTSNFLPAGATQPQPLTFNFGTPSPGGSGVDGLTQYAAASAVSFNQVDGAVAGTLASYQISSDGVVTGIFSNGKTRVLAQLAIAGFEAPDQLERLGGNLYGESRLSGQPNVGFAGTAGRGAVVAGALEQSNVDLAEEFINMIGAQRSFQANSKTIATADQMLQELMTLKR